MAALSGEWLSFVKRRLLSPSMCRVLPDRLMESLSRIVWLANFSRWLRETSCRVTHADRYDLYRAVVAKIGDGRDLDYLEFGVHNGESLEWWVKEILDPNARFYGFDVFTGLPEGWGALPRGAFDVGGRPPAISDPRVHFEIGLFQTTLPAFLARYRHEPGRRKIIHLDADLYSSTLFVLTSLAGELRSEDILIFDEFGSTRNPMHEFRAFHDFCTSYRPSYTVLGATNLYEQVAMRIL